MADQPKDVTGVSRDLERIRAEVRERALHEPRPQVLTAPRPTIKPAPVAAPADPPAVALPPRPDTRAVNEMWRGEVAPRPRGFVGRIFDRLLGPFREAQTAFNARQVQLDNELVAYIDGRFHATHLHYDAVLGIHSKHMQEIDERHLILQEELVAHVHDLVKRIDLVLSESERQNLGLEVTLRDLRKRLEALEGSARPSHG